jgi:non-ribosomal peptide synthetase component F
LQLPVGHHVGDGPSPADAAELRFALDASSLARVQAASVRQRVTPFVMMLSALKMLLSRWTGRTDILLLAPFAARPDAGTRKTIGMFSNLCPLRSDLSGDPRCADVVEQIQETVLRAMQYRCVPYAVLADRLQGRGDISCDGVGVNAVPDGGQVMPRGCGELFGSAMRVTPYVIDTSSMAMRQMRGYLSVWTGFTAGGGITGRLMYPRALYDAVTIARVARAFLEVLDVITQHPHRRLSELTVDLTP